MISILISFITKHPFIGFAVLVAVISLVLTVLGKLFLVPYYRKHNVHTVVAHVVRINDIPGVDIYEDATSYQVTYEYTVDNRIYQKRFNRYSDYANEIELFYRDDPKNADEHVKYDSLSHSIIISIGIIIAFLLVICIKTSIIHN